MGFEPEIWLPKLSKLGLSAYEARVYLALLGEDTTTASKLVRKSGVPQPRVYQALAVLVERGFAELMLGDTKTYRAIAPTAAFERHRRKQELAFEAAMEELDVEMRTLEKESPTEPAGDPSSYGIRLVRGKDAIARVLAELYEQAEEEIVIMLRAPIISVGDRALDEKLKKRGIKKRMLIERASLEDPVHGPVYQEYAEQYGELRWRDKLPVRLGVFDRKLYLLPLQESDDSATLLIVPNEVVSQGMQNWFDEIWQTAKTVNQLPTKKTAKKK